MAFFRSSSVCWFHSLKGMYWVLKPLSSRKSASACNRSSPLMPRSSPVYREYRTNFIEASIVLPPEVRPLGLRLFARLAALLLRREHALLAATDAPVRVQSFQDELAGRCTDGFGLIRREPELFSLLHEPLDRDELLHHRGRIYLFIELQATAEIE